MHTHEISELGISSLHDQEGRVELAELGTEVDVPVSVMLFMNFTADSGRI